MEQTVDLTLVAIDAGTQVRAAINESVVAEYAERMSEGVEFPPIVLFHDGSSYYLADGFHRFMASKRVGFTTIPSVVNAGTKQDALWFALGANKTNGVRLSHADKRRAVEIALNLWPDKSASSIAEQIGVHQTFVSDVRRDLKSALPAEVKGADGKSYPASRQSRTATSRASDVVDRLKRGIGVSAIAAELRMSTRTVQQIRVDAGIAPKLDKTREGISERREQIKKMATEGYTSRQIAAAIGISAHHTRETAREIGVDICADRAVGKIQRHDSNRIIERIVMDADNLTEGVDLIDFNAIDKGRLPEWLASLNDSREKLGVFIRRLMKEQQKHGEAA